MSQLVFLTFFLGLVSGRQTVALNAGPSIQSVAIVLDGQQVAKLAAPPFQTTIDLGPKLAPRELVAIGFDSAGHEVARVSQILNVAHPSAEAAILVASENGKGSAEVRWMHKEHEQPSSVVLTLDEQPLPLDQTNRAALPRLDPETPHVLETEIRFPSGDVARHALTISGDSYSGSIDSELTPVVVRGAASQESLSSCLTAGGHDLRVSAVEKPRAVVVVVKDPDPSAVMQTFAPRLHAQWMVSQAARPFASLDEDTWTNILWPVTEIHQREGNPTMEIYPWMTGVDGHEFGMLWTLIQQKRFTPRGMARMYAGAVAVAGSMAAGQGTRRAVVLLLDRRQKDESVRQPATVRDFLRSIGVPLHVWSLQTPSKEQQAAWGEIDDISTPSHLLSAVKRLRQDLSEQSVVWLATDAWHALHATPNGKCKVEMLASQ